MLEILKTEYIGSYPSEAKCPKSKFPEYAFIGRSNVGKSSLINMLTGRKDLARVSKRPGKTQMVNYYMIDQRWYLVDLPGYGYAQLSKKHRLSLKRMIDGYFQKRKNLVSAVVLLDANVPPQDIDIEFINWLGQNYVPFVIAYTKTDRLKPEEVERNVKRIQDALMVYWNELPKQFITSSVKRNGREDFLTFVEEVNTEFEKNLNS